MAAIRSGANLRRVKDSEKRDRSAAIIPGTGNDGPSAPKPSATPAAGLAGAIQDALAKRKQKVSGSGKSLFPLDFWLQC